MSVSVISIKPMLIGVGIVCLTFVAIGCRPSQSSTEKSATPAKQVEVTLRVAIEDDPELERAIQRLRGEWQEYSGGKIETSLFKLEENSDAVLEAARNADLVIFASRRLGVLCERNAIRPLRPSVLRNETLRFDDFLPLVRNEEIVYGKQTMALPIGCPVPLLVGQSGQEPARIAFSVDFTDPFDRAEAIELATTYLAWAAPHVVHKGRQANLFDPGLGNETLTARIAEPPFVRALEQLKQATTFDGEPNAKIVWPRRNADPRENSESATYSVVMPIGVAEENYNRMAAAWEPLSERDRPATLLASSGRLIAVTTATRNAATAFRYAAWLVSPANSRLLSTASASVANPRGSFAREADNWLAGGDQALGRGIAEALAKSLREERYMLAPRIPGEDRYLESLGKAIRQTLMNRKSASKALAECALDWDEITAELGPNEQNEAYLRSIGSVDYQPDLNRIAR